MSMDDTYTFSEFFQAHEVQSGTADVFCFNKQATLGLPAYIVSKRVHQDHLETGDRTICGMMRNVNYLTNFAYETQVANMIVFINNSVLQLRGYKSNFDDGWWKNHGDVEGSGSKYMRSTFTGEKRAHAEGLLDLSNIPAHSIFTNFFNLYASIEDKNVRSFILESVYYTHRINKKLWEYEQGEQNGQKD